MPFVVLSFRTLANLETCSKANKSSGIFEDVVGCGRRQDQLQRDEADEGHHPRVHRFRLRSLGQSNPPSPPALQAQLEVEECCYL